MREGERETRKGKQRDSPQRTVFPSYLASTEQAITRESLPFVMGLCRYGRSVATLLTSKGRPQSVLNQIAQRTVRTTDNFYRISATASFICTMLEPTPPSGLRIQYLAFRGANVLSQLSFSTAHTLEKSNTIDTLDQEHCRPAHVTGGSQ